MLITLEGIDGSGKTTAAAALQDAFPEPVYTREPTETWYGDAVRRSLNEDDADPIAELFLYTADHAAHLERTVRPALDRGETVISDRYTDSRYAYQAAAIGDRLTRPLEYVRGIHQPWTREPDATLYFDVDPEVGAARSGAANKFERTGFLAAVQANYERLMEAQPTRFIRIDAEQPPEDVIEGVENAVGRLLEDADDDPSAGAG